MRHFNKLTGNKILVFHIFKGKISLLSTEKHKRYDLESLKACFFYEEEAAEEDMF